MNTSRERNLVMALVTVLLIGGGGLLVNILFFEPWRQKVATVATLNREIEEKLARIAVIRSNDKKMQRWQQISLPSDADLAQREYEKFLSEMARKSGAESGAFTVIPPRQLDTKSSPAVAGKGPIYTRLPFTVQGHASLGTLVKMLEGFHKAPLLQQVKNIEIQRPLTLTAQQRPNELDIKLTVEALIVTGAKPRRVLLPEGASDLQAINNLAQPGREYRSIAAKNIFYGPSLKERDDKPPPDAEVMRFVYLTDITDNGRRTEAFLYDRYNNKTTRLRSSIGFDIFKLRDGAGEEVLTGKVVRIDEREVLFQVEDAFYIIHVGQSVTEALRKPVATHDAIDNLLDAIGDGPLW